MGHPSGRGAVLFGRANHDNVAAWIELAQMLILIDGLAIVIGLRVTAERNARRAAESAQALHLSAEARYRDLFYSNQAPILIVDGSGNVIETNASAQRTFGVATSLPDSAPGESHPLPVPDLSVPVRLVDMIGPAASSHILTTLITEQLPQTHSERPTEQVRWHEWNRWPSKSRVSPSSTGRPPPCWSTPAAPPACRSSSRT